MEGATVIDLFAGTGALGLEALSRGASEAVFVERDPVALKCLRENIGACGFSNVARVVSSPVLPFLRRLDLPDAGAIIFADPPYRSGEGTKTLLALAKNAKSLSRSVIVLEHAPGREPDRIPEGMIVQSRRRYGDTCVMFLSMGAQGG